MLWLVIMFNLGLLFFIACFGDYEEKERNKDYELYNRIGGTDDKNRPRKL